MFSWVARAKHLEPAILGFGKVPSAAEYLRCGPRSPAASDFEQWLVGAIEWAAGFRAERWKAGYDHAATNSFVYRTSVENQLIAGVVGPSRDSVGRRFPLVIAVQCHSRALSAGNFLAPIVMSAFFQRAADLLPTVSAARSCSDFERTVQKLDLPDFARVDVEAARYGDWTRDTVALELFAKMLPDSTIDATHALHVVLDAVAPFKGKEAPRTSLSVRLPLPSSAPGPEVCAFWLDVVRRASGWKQTVPGFFAEDGRHVLVQLGEPANGSVLADAWMPDPASDFVCDLVTTNTASILTPMPERLSATLSAPGSSLADVLAQIEA